MLCPMELGYLTDVVAIHMTSFPKHFLSFLGERFLAQYYRGLILSRRSIAVLSIDEAGVPNGFATGVIDPSGFYAELLKKHWVRFMLASIPAVMKKPRIIPKLIGAFKKPESSCRGTATAELTSVCVLPSHEGLGLGKQLINAFIDMAGDRACGEVVLYTDAYNNERANCFYSNLGFSVVRKYTTPEGRRMNECRRIIARDE